MTTTRDIIVSKLKRLGCDGLASPDADCGCGIADLAPCGGTCMDCLPARSRVTSEGIGWYAVGFVKLPHDDKESNTPRMASTLLPFFERTTSTTLEVDTMTLTPVISEVPR